MRSRAEVVRLARRSVGRLEEILADMERRGRPTTTEQREWARVWARVQSLLSELDDLQRTRHLDDRPKLRPWAKSLRGLLLHEAAHAVVGVALHERVNGIHFEYQHGRPTGSGWTVFGRDARKLPAVVSLAGPIAEMWEKPVGRLRFRQLVEAGEARSDTDYTDAKRRVALGPEGPGNPRTIEAAWAEAAATLRANWAAVEELADRCADAPHGFLEGKAIHDVCKRHRVEWMPAQS